MTKINTILTICNYLDFNIYLSLPMETFYICIVSTYIVC